MSDSRKITSLRDTLFIYPYSVNAVVPASEVLSTALLFATRIVENSPDAVQSTKKALLLLHKYSNEETVATHVKSPESKRAFRSENIKVLPFAAFEVLFA